ncbi:MAG: DUF6807 family protein [Gemmataceae bacterium]
MRQHLSLLAVILLASLTPAATVEFTVSAGKHKRTNEPVRVPLLLSNSVPPGAQVTVKDSTGKQLAVGQLTQPDLVTESIEGARGKQRLDLHFILPQLDAGKALALKADIDENPGKAATDAFAFENGSSDREKWIELRQGERPVWRFMHTPWSGPAKDTGNPTSKVYHHVFDPAAGKQLLTNGAEGKFPHHRGVFYGFSKTTYGKNTVDIWHCRGDVHQSLAKVESAIAGPVLGRHLLNVDWIGVGKKPFAHERRELTAYAVPGGTLLEFVSKLTPTGESVRVDGDPQHAGFQFRAAQEVEAKTEKQTIYIRPDGVDKPGATRNWDGKKHTDHVNLPWLAMSFVVGGQRYTTAYLDRPENPKEARFSERAYGRFGSYFVATATREKPLVVRYRLWIQPGQMTPAQVAQKSHAWVEPVEVRVK